ncbi:MAG: recombinase family protein [Clostridia bacterium]|nr:recombinase family protein [Clostridia bacterium]
MYILTNEKHRGDALLQKTFTVDFLTKKHKVNEGEAPRYYVKGNHEAIIPPNEFDQVQAEIARRKKIGKAYSGNSFGSKIVCGECFSAHMRVGSSLDSRAIVLSALD